RSRRVIWSGFFGLALMSLTIWLVGVLPSAAGWEAQEAYQQILMTAPRIAGASMVAYFVGELLNSFVMS
ncbi:MAG TPA: transporter, partial [Firmicutes bacterium]|nr:transporter [Bacillota bacterium]